MGFWEPLFFWILAVGAVVTSLGVLVFRNPLYCALSLIVDFFCFAGLYALLSAHFLAITQILVYAGAIMVLFVFIIMLLNLSDAELGPRKFSLHHLLAVLAGVGIFGFSAYTLGALVDTQKIASERQAAQKKVEAAREKAQEAEADGEKPDKEALRPYIATESKVPGLYADLSESAVDRIYRQKLQAWESGASTPAEGKWRPFRPGRSFELPPALAGPASPKDGAEQSGRRVRPEDRQEGLFGTVEPISILLVNRFVIPFELTAVLLLAAIVGAVIIAKKRL